MFIAHTKPVFFLSQDFGMKPIKLKSVEHECGASPPKKAARQPGRRKRELQREVERRIQLYMEAVEEGRPLGTVELGRRDRDGKDKE